MVQWFYGAAFSRRYAYQTLTPFFPVIGKDASLLMKSSIGLPCKRRINNAPAFWLSLCWCAGLLLGVFLSSLAEADSLALMCAAAVSRVSIFDLLFVLFLPFLLTACAVFLSQLWLLYPIALGKALSFGYTAGLLSRAFHSAWWLLRILLMFSDCLVFPLLCWFWLRRLSRGSGGFRRDFAICAGLTAGIGILDFAVIAPFLAGIFV